MKRTLLILATVLLLSACGDSEKQLMERAAELCKYIPDHELREESREYMTEDFYNVLDTMFNLMPEFEAMDHEWLYYFVTGNGGTIADFEVTGVEQQDNTHAVATISVRQEWEDGSFDPSSDIEEHRLYMEKVDGRWLISDFDEHKADCIRHIAINRWEQKLRAGITSFLIEEFGTKYTQGDLCIPVLMIVAEEDCETEIAWVWGDFWIRAACRLASSPTPYTLWDTTPWKTVQATTRAPARYSANTMTFTRTCTPTSRCARPSARSSCGSM